MNNRPPKENVSRLVSPAAANLSIASPGELDRIVCEIEAIKWGVWYRVTSSWEGDFLERIMSGSCTKTLADQQQPDGTSRIRLMVNHGSSGDGLLIGRILSASEGPTGLDVIAELPRSNPVAAGMEDTLDLMGASIRMAVLREDFVLDPGVSEWNPLGLPERTIREIRLAELGPVVFAASPTTTVKVRSLADEAAFAHLRQLPPERLREVARFCEPAAVEPSPTSRELDTSPAGRAAALASIRKEAA